MTIRFRSSKGKKGGLTAKQVRLEFEKIRKSKGGHLKPEDVVHMARAKTSPLHDLFEWDNTAAAEKFRLIQARTIIRQIVIYTEENKSVQPAYLSIKTEKERYYQDSEVALENETELSLALRDLLAKLGQAERAVAEVRGMLEGHPNESILATAALEAIATARSAIERIPSTIH